VAGRAGRPRRPGRLHRAALPPAARRGSAGATGLVHRDGHGCDRGRGRGRDPVGGAPAGLPPYLLLVAGFFVCGFHITFIGTHLPAYLNDIGLSRADGTRALAVIGLFNIAGSFAAGWLGARHSKAKLLSLVYALRAVAIVGLVLLPHTSAATVAFAAAMGVLWLATVPLTSAIVVGHFGVRHAGSLFGVVFLSHQVGAFVGVWYGGRLADSVGSYTPVWWIAAGLGVAAAALHLFIDESPAPPLAAPQRPRAAVLRPAAGVLVLVVGLVSASFGARSGLAAESAATAWFCPLHPAVTTPAAAAAGSADAAGS
jgi:MFS family permease